MTNELLGITTDGCYVYDRHNSHLHYEGGLTKDLLAEAISRINSKDITKKNHKFVINFGHTIGYTTCVDIDNTDETVNVYRKGRKGWTRMVKNRQPKECSEITVIIRRFDGILILITAYIGASSPKEPWDPSIRTNKERVECAKFWSKHALIYDETLIQ